MERGAGSVEEAYDLVARLEAISQSAHSDDDMYRGKVRGVDHPTSNNNGSRITPGESAQLTGLSKTVTELQESMRQLVILQQQQQQQLSDVYGRLEQKFIYAPTTDPSLQQGRHTAYPGAAAAAAAAAPTKTALHPERNKNNNGCWQCGSLAHRRAQCPETDKTASNQHKGPAQAVQSGLPDFRQQKASLSATIRLDGRITYVKLMIDTGPV